MGSTVHIKRCKTLLHVAALSHSCSPAAHTCSPCSSRHNTARSDDGCRPVKSAKKRVLITKIKNTKGECITCRKGIADTFGEFYKRLYEDSGKNNSEQEEGVEERILEITSEEIQAAICKLKAGKSPDGNGIRAEDIKACDDETREMMRQIFNEIIKRNKLHT